MEQLPTTLRFSHVNVEPDVQVQVQAGRCGPQLQL